jgi:two-component system, OmpR family, KDP operon response regulator KdpE
MTGGAARVLVVDDEPQILRALRAALAGHGYAVQTATNGAEALDAIAIHPPMSPSSILSCRA